MPTLRPKRRILGAEPDADGGLEAGGDCQDQRAAVRAVALGDRQRGRNDLGRGMAQRRPVDIADRDGGDQVSVQQRGSGKRERLAADDARLARGAERGSECADLPALVAVASGDRARQRVEDDVLDALADRGGKLIVFEIRDEARELGGRSGGLSGDWSGGGHGRISDQSSFAPESFTALAHFTISDLTSVVNSSVVEIAGSAARPISFSRISGCRWI